MTANHIIIVSYFLNDCYVLLIVFPMFTYSGGCLLVNITKRLLGRKKNISFPPLDFEILIFRIN